jgi:hypothetical protein
MSDSFENKEKGDREKTVNDEYLEQVSLANSSQMNLLNKDEMPSLASNNTLNDNTDQETNNESTAMEESPSYQETKSILTENIAKRSKSDGTLIQF